MRKANGTYWIVAIPLTAIAGGELALGIQRSSASSVLGAFCLLALAIWVTYRSLGEREQPRGEQQESEAQGEPK